VNCGKQYRPTTQIIKRIKENVNERSQHACCPSLDQQHGVQTEIILPVSDSDVENFLSNATHLTICQGFSLIYRILLET
jgi:hypothetical protein